MLVPGHSAQGGSVVGWGEFPEMELYCSISPKEYQWGILVTHMHDMCTPYSENGMTQALLAFVILSNSKGRGDRAGGGGGGGGSAYIYSQFPLFLSGHLGRTDVSHASPTSSFCAPHHNCSGKLDFYRMFCHIRGKNQEAGMRRRRRWSSEKSPPRGFIIGKGTARLEVLFGEEEQLRPRKP